MIKKNLHTLGIILIIITIAGGLGFFFVLRDPCRQKLCMIFLDVGQGDSILVRTPQGRAVLIDGGPDRSVLSELGDALPFYQRRIDMVVLTHPDADHVVGLVDVLKRFNVRHVTYTGVEGSNSAYEAFEELIAQKSISTTFAEAGNTFVFDDNITFTVLFPFESFAGKSVEDINGTSVVMKMTYADTVAIFTGDASVDVEKQMLSQSISLDADILKVGHHGSRTSTSEKFIDAVSPKYAIIQSEIDNDFGHPHPEVIERLQSRDIHILRNDQQGMIWVISDGEKIGVKTEK